MKEIFKGNDEYEVFDWQMRYLLVGIRDGIPFHGTLSATS